MIGPHAAITINLSMECHNMSHFVECQTEFRDPQALVAALIERVSGAMR
jgi:hypothetical protein